MFYVLKNPTSDADMAGRAVTDFEKVDPRLGEAPLCPRCNAAVSQMPWLPPHRATLEPWTNQYGDMAFGGLQWLITVDVAKSFQDEGLVGLQGFDPVEICGVIRRGGARPPTRHPEYLCVSAVRSQATINLDATFDYDDDHPPICDVCRTSDFRRIKGIYIENRTWDGEDIFIARGLPGTYLASERFKSWFERLGVNNGILIPAQDYRKEY